MVIQSLLIFNSIIVCISAVPLKQNVRSSWLVRLTVGRWSRWNTIVDYHNDHCSLHFYSFYIPLNWYLSLWSTVRTVINTLTIFRHTVRVGRWCGEDIALSMKSNRFQLNTDKTEVLECATWRIVNHTNTARRQSLQIGSDVVASSLNDHDLGIYLDYDLSKKSHVLYILPFHVSCAAFGDPFHHLFIRH